MKRIRKYISSLLSVFTPAFRNTIFCVSALRRTFIVSAVILLPLFTACESLLDVDPSDRYSADTFWKTEEHAKAGLSGCYRALLPWRAEHFFEFDLITSNAMPYNESNGTHAIGKGEHLSTTPLITTLWDNCYTGIGRTNTFLDNISGVTMDDNLRSRMTGEAKFLRAFFYFHLADKFGGVPLITETPNSEKHATLPRDSKEAVVEQILKDLTEAAPVLPNTYSGADLGRVAKGAALALKARVLLYNQRWSEAAEAAKAVMDMNVYSLFPDYRYFFSEANKHNVEVIFNVESSLPDFQTTHDQTIFRLNRPAPLKELVDQYQMIDGKSIRESPLYDPEKPYENRDPRLHYTVTVIGYPYNGKLITKQDVMTTGFGMKKYTSYTDDEEIPLVERSAFNSILIRYAEVLLSYAEAQNEASGPDASVYDALNHVRRRAGVAMPDIQPGLTKEQLREAIRLERRVELALEGLYYSDILRWKTAEIENNGAMHDADDIEIVIRKFRPDRDYLWPIPYNQTVLNPNLVQNPNWD
ncbi:MAG: RagB/SusD family nutrient uptake outer membrane protein [Tannerella sp.]|nr:RagB/SusD family nutrient uptake outer membrane protein [Tannerella sp.]